MTEPRFARQADLSSQAYFASGREESQWEQWLLRPGVLVPAAVLAFTVFYQWLHSSPFSIHNRRHPGQFLWDLLVTAIPTSLLHALDAWLYPPMFPVVSLSARVTPPRSHAAKSELLQKLLGVDSSIMRSVAGVGRKSLATLAGSTIGNGKRIGQPAGLGNRDNSCFQNSILQSLSALEPVLTYLNTITDVDEGGTCEGGSADTLRHLLGLLRDQDSNGQVLWTPQKLKSLNTWQQQDAQEYFSKLLDEMDKEVAKIAKVVLRPSGLEALASSDDGELSQHSDDSGYQSTSSHSKAISEARLFRNPLEGLIAQRVACVSCGYSEGLSMIPFNCLTLNLGVGTTEHDLYERLDSYAHLESIDGVECGKCTLLKARHLLTLLIQRVEHDGRMSASAMRMPLARLEAANAALQDEDFADSTLSQRCHINSQHRVASTKTKQAVIARAPRSLAVHMNRSVFDERTGHMFKNPAAVRFPKTLDLGPWCLGSAVDMERIGEDSDEAGGGGDGVAGSAGVQEERWLSDPEKSMIAGDTGLSRISGPMYELRAVITHQGQHENGHYVCFRRHPRPPRKLRDAKGDNMPVGDEEDGTEKTWLKGSTESGGEDSEEERKEEGGERGDREEDKWWRLSDETVWEVSEDVVLAQGGVFMLFYDCVDSSSVFLRELREEEAEEKEKKNRGNSHDMPSDYHQQVLEMAAATLLPDGEEDEFADEDGDGTTQEDGRAGDDQRVLQAAVAAPLPTGGNGGFSSDAEDDGTDTAHGGSVTTMADNESQSFDAASTTPLPMTDDAQIGISQIPAAGSNT